MSIAVFRDHIEQIWNKGDASAIQRFIAPNYLGVDPAEPEPISGDRGLPPTLRPAHDRLPRHCTSPSTTSSASTTMSPPASPSKRPTPATSAASRQQGGRCRVTIVAIVRVTRGQIVVEHANSDALGLLKQLGVIEDPPKVPALLF